MENKEWLNELKVGDKVFVVTTHFGNAIRELEKVKRITPTRRIVVNNLTFINGYVPNNSRYKTGQIYLEPVTQESLKKFQENQFKKIVLDRIKLINKNNITFEQTQQLNEILNLGVQYETIKY